MEPSDPLMLTILCLILFELWKKLLSVLFILWNRGFSLSAGVSCHLNFFPFVCASYICQCYFIYELWLGRLKLNLQVVNEAHPFEPLFLIVCFNYLLQLFPQFWLLQWSIYVWEHAGKFDAKLLALNNMWRKKKAEITFNLRAPVFSRWHCLRCHFWFYVTCIAGNAGVCAAYLWLRRWSNRQAAYTVTEERCSGGYTPHKGDREVVWTWKSLTIVLIPMKCLRL